MMNIKRTAEDAAAGEDPDELYLAAMRSRGCAFSKPVGAKARHPRQETSHCCAALRLSR
jgi:hypothetical protein